MIYQLRTLGGIDLIDAEGREVRALLAQPKRLALLVYLATAKQYRRRDTVIGLFWPELDEEHARGALRQALRFLRRELRQSVIVTRGEDEVGIEPGALQCDALVVGEAADAGRNAQALDLYRGDFLEGFFVSDASPEFEVWMDGERDRLKRLISVAAWRVAAEQKAARDWSAAAATAKKAAGFLPDDEGEVRRLIGFLDQLGDRAAALATYDKFADRLAREFEAEPAPETRELLRIVRERERVNGLAQTSGMEKLGLAVAAHPGPERQAGRRRMALLVIALTIAITGMVEALRVRAASDRRPTLAVLPTEDLSGDTADSYLVEGMTDQLITDLAMTRGFAIINRRTMMEFRNSPKGPQDIARELKASAVLVTAIRRLRDTVSLSAQLTLGEEDRVLWGQSFLATRGDLFRISGEVARSVARQMRATIASSAPGTIRPYDPEALDLYIKARFWWNKRGPSLIRSIELFDQALQIDPTFALAYSGTADAYVQLGYTSSLAPDDAFPKARDAARRALALDSTLAEPHATLGYVAMYYDWDWATAEKEFRRSLEINPSYATGHEWYGLFLTAMGRFDEAMVHERRAQELDPLSTAIAGTAGWVLYYSGRMADAERELKIALRMDPSFGLGHFYLSRVYLAQGQLDSALAESHATGSVRMTVPTIAGEAYIHARAGRPEKARSILAQLDSMSRSQYVTAYAVAVVHAALGETDSTFFWLDQAVNERTHWLVWLNRDSRWDPVRDEPRFGAVVRRVGLPR